MRSFLYLNTLLTLPSLILSSPWSSSSTENRIPYPCSQADLSLDISPKHLDPLSSTAANITFRERGLRHFRTYSRIFVKEDEDAKEITIDYDLRVTDEDLKSTITLDADSDENTVSLIIDGTDYGDGGRRWDECIVAITTVTIPKSLSHLIFTVDNAPLSFRNVKSEFEKLEVYNKNGHVGFYDSSCPSIKDLVIDLRNGAVSTDDTSELATTKSATIHSSNGSIHARISGPSLVVDSNNGAVNVIVPDSPPSSSSTSTKKRIKVTSSNGSVQLSLLAPSSPFSIFATSNAGRAATTIYSPSVPGTFHLESNVGSTRANGNLHITKAKHGLVGGMLEGYWGSSPDDDDDSTSSSVEIISKVGSASLTISDDDHDDISSNPTPFNHKNTFQSLLSSLPPLPHLIFYVLCLAALKRSVGCLIARRKGSRQVQLVVVEPEAGQGQGKA